MKYIIGIDEVGRGPLAGPVVVAAVCFPATFSLINRQLGRPRDSKQISQAVREAWFDHSVQHQKISYAIAKVGPAVIDRVNISKAANRAAMRACERLIENNGLSARQCSIYLDGSLYIKNKAYSKAMGARTVIKGDQRIPAVALASIIAKVTRDRLMVRLAKQYPHYGFEIHKGYGTVLHRKRLRKHGPSPIHRLTFLG